MNAILPKYRSGMVILTLVQFCTKYILVVIKKKKVVFFFVSFTYFKWFTFKELI